MADSLFALLNQNVGDQLKKMPKTKKGTLKGTDTWLNVWQTWATERRLNPKLEDYKHDRSFIPCRNWNPKISVCYKKQRLDVRKQHRQHDEEDYLEKIYGNKQEEIF